MSDEKRATVDRMAKRLRESTDPAKKGGEQIRREAQRLIEQADRAKRGR